VGFWGLGLGGWAQTPNPQSPIPIKLFLSNKMIFLNKHQKNE